MTTSPQDDLTAERADLAAIKLSVKRYRGPSEHDTCVKDMKVLLAALKTARQEALREACIAVSQFSSDGRPIDAQELRIALVQLLGEMAK